MVDSKYLVGDKKASCPPRREESVDQKTLECKAKSKTQGEREKKMQKEQSEKVQRGKRRNIGRVAARTVTIVDVTLTSHSFISFLICQLKKKNPTSDQLFKNRT